MPAFNPFSLQLAAIQRRQAVADALQQQAITPIPSQVSGTGSYPVVVRTSPLEYAAQLGKGYLSNKIATDNDARYNALAQAMMGAQQQSIAQLAGGESSAQQPLAAAPQALDAPSGTSQGTTTSAPPNSATPSAAPSFQQTLEAAQQASMYGVDPEVVKAAIGARAPTDQQKNDLAAGIGSPERGQIIRRESLRQSYVPGSGGIVDANAQGQPSFQNLPGMAESQANLSGLTTATQEANKPRWVDDPLHPGQGRFLYPQPGPALRPGATSGAGGVTDLGAIGRGRGAPNAGDLEGQKVGAKVGYDYAQELTNKSAAALDGKRTLSEMTGLLQGFNPGAFTPVAAKLGAAAQALGVDPGVVQSLTGVNPGDAEAFQKGTAALATEAAKQVSNRVTQMEFKVFIANNPNWMMTPTGIKKVMSFMDKGFDQQIQMQNQFSQWSKDKSPDKWAIDFPAVYNQQQLKRIESGQMRSTPSAANTTETAADLASSAGAPVSVASKGDYDKLSSGTKFVGPDGVTYRKP